jgi:hypothetical protein
MYCAGIGVHVLCRYYCQIFMTSEFIDRVSKNNKTVNFMKIREVAAAAELFHADRQTGRHDEANSHSSQSSERA